MKLREFLHVLLRAIVLVLFFIPIAETYGATIEQTIKELDPLDRRERLTTLENNAKKGGRIRWASSTPIGNVEGVLQTFKKKYPAITLEYNRLSGRVLADRVIREYQVGKYDVDVAGPSAVSFAAVKDAGVVTSYVSPESSAIKPGMKDPKGFWTSRYSNVVCIVCNKNKVKTMPTDWKDFTDPKWKGDFSIDSERYNWFFALTKVYGSDGARNLIGGYMRNGALVYRSTPLQIQLVAAGEFSCALGVFLNDVVLLMKGGAPLSYAVPQPVLLNPNIIMMPKFPPNPAGAILLYDYLLSVEGLSPMTSNTPHMPSREDVPVTEEIRELRSKRLYFTDVEEQSRTFSQIGETYNALLKKQ